MNETPTPKTTAEIMAEKRAAAISKIKDMIWGGEKPETVATLALAIGVTQEQVKQIEADIAAMRETIEAANAVDLAALEAGMTAAQGKAKKTGEELEKVEAAHMAAARAAGDAEQAFQAGKNKVFLALHFFESPDQLPPSVTPSPSVMAMIESEKKRIAAEARHAALSTRRREISSRLGEIKDALNGVGGALFTTGRDQAAIKKINTEKADLEAELQKVVEELGKVA